MQGFATQRGNIEAFRIIRLSDNWARPRSDFSGIIQQPTRGLIGPLDKGCLVPAADVREVIRLHDEPDTFYGIEVGRIRRKRGGFEEVPLEVLALMS